MSFQPIFNITRIPRASTAFYIVDATGNSPDNPTGFGAANAPANLAAITSVYGGVQPYGEDITPSTSVSGTLGTEAEIDVAIPDGVNTLITYYGELKTTSWTLSSDRLTLTADTPGAYTALLDNVDSLSDGTIPIPIMSKDANSVTLTTKWPGTVTSGTQFYRYFKATKIELTINAGFGRIVNNIAKLSYKADKWPDALDITFDQIRYNSAIYEFANGNYARAHEAARLITFKKPATANNCYTCGN